jgi:sterol desaturase/sphingolipid hydroxylase (fatty acid hydroxylase superfamily)
MGPDPISQEMLIRLGFFAAVFCCVAIAEAAAPRRPLSVSKARRWFANLAMQGIDAVIPRLLSPLLPVGLALLMAERGWGLLNVLPIAPLAANALGVMALDLTIYLQHVLFHRIPLLWRLHRVHHTDRDIDVTTGLRFHPVEIMLSLMIKLAVVAAAGAPAAAVLIFEVLLNGASMFNHGNIRIPLSWDRIVRTVLVTPDMHRVHHSVIVRETDSNFGFSVSWWDRLFGTYRDQPAEGHDRMRIGLKGYHDDRSSSLASLLIMPFVK